MNAPQIAGAPDEEKWQELVFVTTYEPLMSAQSVQGGMLGGPLTTPVIVIVAVVVGALQFPQLTGSGSNNTEGNNATGTTSVTIDSGISSSQHAIATAANRMTRIRRLRFITSPAAQPR
jgi:hypothetical protein